MRSDIDSMEQEIDRLTRELAMARWRANRAQALRDYLYGYEQSRGAAHLVAPRLKVLSDEWAAKRPE